MKHIFVLASLALFSACAHVDTELTPLVSRKYKGQGYSRIMAFAAGADLKSQVRRENQLCLALIKNGAKCWRSIDLFPPTEQASETQKKETLKNRGITGILQVGMTGATVAKNFVPPTYSTNCSTDASGTQTCTESLSGGGYHEERPIGTYRAQMVDVASGDVMWIGDVSARGSAQSNFSEVDEETIATVIENLSKAGMIRPVPEAPVKK